MKRPSAAQALPRGAAALLALLFSFGCVTEDVITVTIGTIGVQPGTASLLEAETLQFRASVQDDGGRALPRATVSWTSEDPAIVSVDSEGMVTAVSAGDTRVTAEFRGVTGTATVTVIPAPAVALSVNTASFLGAVGSLTMAPLVIDISNGGGGILGGLAAGVVYTNGQPEGWLQVTLSSTQAPTTLTIVALIGALPVGIYDAVITISSPDDPNSPAFIPISLSLTGFTVVESGGTTVVTEGGSTDSITVVLDTPPDSNVVLNVVSGDPGEVTATPGAVTFTPANWATPQTVVLTGQDELVSDGDQIVPVLITVDDALSDDRFDPIPDDTVGATVIDDDTPSVTIVESGGATSVNESGTTDGFTVVLDVEPLSAVVLSVTSLDVGEAIAGPSTLTFTPADWATPQTVTVTGVNDDLIDGTQNTGVAIVVDAGASDDAFDTLAPDTVSVSNGDNDVAGFGATRVGGAAIDTLVVTEAGSTLDFELVLSAEPATDVVLTIVSGDTGEVLVTPGLVTFTAANWSTPVTLSVAGADDDEIDGDQISQVTLTIDVAGSDDNFDAIPPLVVPVRTVDDDAAGFLLSESGGGTLVDEGGATDAFTAVLLAQPQSDVVLDVVSGNVGEVTVSTASLTFTVVNWNVPQSVTVTGVDELIDDGDQIVTVTVAVDAAASDNDFDALAAESVLVTNVDDDTAGFTLVETAGGTLVSETGTTDDFTVVLESEPVSDVVITMLASDATEATVTPTNLTFTPLDWNVAQTVTVTGVDDILDDDDQFSVIAVAVSGALSDDVYDPLPDQIVTVTTTDNDSPAGFSITAIGGTTVTEAGGTDDFTVVLDAQPATDVVVDVSSADVGEAVVAPATLTFTSATWNTPQTVTVTGVDDNLIDGVQTTTITASVNDAASDDNFDILPDEALIASTTDDDIAGLVIIESDGSSLVGEGGSTDDFTVALTARPFTDVEISLASGDLGEVTIAPATLTFTNGNWNAPQTVTMTGVDDPVIDFGQFTPITIAVVDANSDDNFDPVADRTVTVQTTDNDQPGVSVSESGGSTTVTEAGGTDDFTVVLDAQPASDVVLNVVSGDAGEVTVSPSTLTFTPLNWSTPQTVTLTGVDDFVLDGDVLTTVAVSVDPAQSDNQYDPVPPVTVTATTTDDDGAGFTLVESGGVTIVAEGGTSDGLTVVLTAEPASAVQLDLAVDDASEATVSPAQITLTGGAGGNWNIPQPITVTGVDDDLTDGDQLSTLSISVNQAGSDNAYDFVPPQFVAITTQDDDVAGFVVAESDGGTLVSESGGQDQFTLVLATQPVSDVALDIVGSDIGEAVLSPTSLTFNATNWNTPQTVTVTGVNDPMIDGDQLSTATISVRAGSDAAFTGLPDQVVTITTSDDDAAGILVAETGGQTTITEAGSSDAIDLVLTSQPASDVVVVVSSASLTEVTVAPDTVTFTALNWAAIQSVTVTGVDELIDDGDQVTVITIAVDAAASDDDFDALPAQTVNATTVDDDVAGVTVVQTDGGTLVSENGSLDIVTVVLDTEPTSSVVVNVASDDVGEATVAPISLIFTPANWSTAQTVTVTGVDDLLDDGDQNSTITIAVDAPGSDDAFDSVLPIAVTVTTTDNDAPVGVTVTAIGGTTVTEAGGTDDFTVVLDSEPATNVVLTVASGDTGEAAVAPTTLTFTNGNWNAPQTVTVTGVDDAVLDGSQISTVTVSVDAPNSDDSYDLVADETLAVTTTDDDVAGYTVTESDGSTLVNESGTTDDISVVLDAEPATDVVIDASSADTGEATVGPTPLTFTAANWNVPQTVTVTGVDDALLDGSQVTVLTFSLNAGASDDDFDLLVDHLVSVTTTDDDGAAITVTASDGTTVVTEGGSTDDFSVVLSSGPATDVVVTVTSGDTGEATVLPTTLTFTSLNWFTPQTVTVTGVDDALVDLDQITTITIAVDDLASDDTYDGLSETLDATTTDDDGAGITITESGGTTSVTEPGTTDDFSIVLDAQPTTAVSLDITSADAGEATVSSTTLTFTNANWDTPQSVTVTAADDDLIDGAQATVITVAVDALSSAPEYGAVTDASVTVTTLDDDIAAFTITESGAGTLVTEAGSTDGFTVVLETQPLTDVVLDVSIDDPTEASVAPALLTFTTLNWDTPQPVTVTGVDDALIDGSVGSLITLAVDAAASDDDYDPLTAQTVSVTTTDDDAGGFTVIESSGTTVVTEAGATDDLAVALTSQPATDVVLTVGSANAGEVTVAPDTLTFTSADWDTPQSVTLTGVDDLIDDGDAFTTVTISVDAATSDDNFDPAPDQLVSVTTMDDDEAGFTTTQTAGGTLVTELGSTDDFTVVLDTEPVSDVVITVASVDTGEATIAPGILTFTPANWFTAQTVTVTGVDDLLNDGDQFTSITVAIDAAASDDTYDPVLDGTVTVTTTDNDAPVGVTVTAIGGTTVTEAGGTDDFTVVLDSEPATNVVLTVASEDTGEAAVAPTTLTFTNGNWNAPQTVTVTGVDDAVLDGSQISTVTVSVDVPNSDDSYDLVADETVAVTTTDDDVAGYTVTESDGSTLVNESGTTDDISVVLDAEPATDVVIDVSSADTGEATVGPTPLTFTAANWNVPQTVTVTGVDDALLDGSQITVLTFSLNAGASDDDFDLLVDHLVSVTTTDDDGAAITVTPSGGTTVVTEGGSTDDFSVVLSSGPATDVVVTVTSGDTGEATVLPATLTFTSLNWFTPQTVTVTGVDDALVDLDQITTITIAVDDLASDDTYDGLSETLDATTTDDDGAGITITESGGTTSVTEPGTTDDFSIVLDAQPATNVVVDVSSADAGEATVSSTTLTFTNVNWDTPQSVTVTAADDDLIDGPQVTLVTLAVDDLLSDDTYDPLADLSVSVTTEDEDVAGITIAETGGGTIVTEAAGTDDFTVVLETQPLVDVVLDISIDDLTEATVAPALLTFTTLNWDTPQTVTVTGVDDALIDGSQLSQVTIAVNAATSDDTYDALADGQVNVTTSDDDGAGYTVAETGGNTFVTEAGGSDSFSVVLGAQPTSDVVFDITPSDATEATVSSATLTFTPASWSTPQVVTVTGVDDSIDDGSVVSTVTVSIDPSSDDAFDPLPNQAVTVTTTDDDAAGFTVAESSGTTSVTEAGSTDDFTVVLDTEPTSSVELTVTSANPSEATVSTGTLTFTPANWNVAQSVTVTGVDDLVNDGNQITSIAIVINDGPSDDTFDPLPDQAVFVTTTDDDQAGFTVTQTGGGTSVSEAGTTDDFTLVLTSQPASNVVLTVASGDLGEATVAPATLTFTSTTWDTPQTVTVTGIDDAFDDGDRFTLVTITVDDTNSDDAYDPLANQTVSVTTIDDDGVGFTIVQSAGNSIVSEAGSTDDFTVVLDAQPASDVVLDLVSADLGEVTVSPATLTFTAASWNTPQAATLTGVDDLMDDGSVVTFVTVSVDAALSDDVFDAVANQDIGVTTTDDDGAGFTIVEIGGTSVTEAGSTDVFTITLDAQPLSNVVLTVTSGDTGEQTVSPATLTFTNANWNAGQPVTVTGVDDAIDDGDVITTVTLSVDDAASDDAFDPVANEVVSVTTLDDDSAGFQIVETGGGTLVTEAGGTDSFTVVLLSEPVANVVLDVASSNLAEATVNTSGVIFTAATWNVPHLVIVTGVDDQVDDGDQVTPISVTVNAGASDDAFDALPPGSVSVTTTDDDTAGLTIAESGGGTTVDESGTTDEFTVVLDSEPVSNVVLAVASTDLGEATVSPATVTFTPGNWSSAQFVTVIGVDDALIDGPVGTGVVLSVDDLNSDDAYDPLTDVVVTVTTTDDDGAGFSVTETGGGTAVSESGGTDTFDVVLTAQPVADVVFDVTSADTGEATVAPAVLTFTNANWNAPQAVTVTGVDDVIQDGPQLTAISISVNAPASDDAFDLLTAQTVTASTSDDDAASYVVTETGGSTSVSETGTTDAISIVLGTQPTSDVVVTVVSSGLDEVTASPASLTFTNVNWASAQIVTVTGVDDPTVDGPQVTLVTVSVDDAASDDAFDPLADETVNVTTLDDDVAAFTLTESTGATEVSEAGTTDDFTIVLDRQPLTNVVFDVASADVTEMTVSPVLVTFTPADWNVSQTVTVTGVDDAVDDGDVVTLATVAVNVVNSDDAFDPLPAQSVNVTTTDDDIAGFTMVESGGSTLVDESGSTDDFTVILTSQPTSLVLIDLSSSNTAESTVSPATLTFTPADWSTPQTVIVTGVDDDVIDGPVPSTITLTVDDAGSDDTFDPLPDQTVGVTTTDDDAAGFTVAETGGTSVSEAGTTDNFTVVLEAQPSSNVVFTVVSADIGEATVAPGTITFTPGNWNSAQTVTVTGVDDLVDDGDQNSTVTISIDAGNSDDDFDPLVDQTVSVTTVDDDGAGFTVAESGGGTSVAETGTTDDFTVVLTAQPATNVVLTVTSADLGETTVAPATLTFTNANWSVAQTVTATGIDDLNDDGDQITSVTISIDDALSDDAYDPVLNQIASVTTVDNDIAGFSVVHSGGGTIVSETGSTDDFTVVLTSQPVTNVVLTVVSGDVGEATVDLPTLTFTDATWSVPQTVTVAGVDDALVDSFQFTTITVSVDDANSDAAYDPLGDQFISVTTTDDDAAAFVVTESGGGSTVAESGTTDDFTVVLSVQPFGDVVFDVSSGDTSEATISVSTLTFNNGNWNTPQTVTITGVDDDVIDAGQSSTITVSVNAAATEDSFDGMPNQTVIAAVTDDDVAGFTVAESLGTTVVTEVGSTDDFTVVLDAEPLSNVVIAVSSPDIGEVTTVPATLTFTPLNWNVTQTVTVTGVDDDIDDGDQITLVDLSINATASDDDFDALASRSVSTTTTDDDAIGFLVVESGGSTTVAESGTTDDFTVVLSAEPLSDVVIDITSGDAAEAIVDLPALTFTNVTWNVPQTVTVTGVDDAVDDGDQITGITVSIDDLLSDDQFDLLADQAVNATTTDDDGAAFATVEPGGSTTVDESGTTDSFDVTIATEPVAAVVIDVTSGDTNEVTVAPAQLTFTSANWLLPQTVTVTGADDGLLVDGDVPTNVTLSINDAGSDAAYDPLSDQQVTVTTTDNDVGGFSVVESGGGTVVDESGATDDFTVELTAQPETNVVFDVSSGDTGEASVAPSQLMFTTANWNTPQTVTVTGVDDAPLLDGDQATTLTVGVNVILSNDAFDALFDQSVIVTTTDDQVAGYSVTESGGTSVSESGTTDNFTVVLDVQPDADVTFTVVSGDLGEVTVSPATLTFTSGNWNTAQSVIVTGVPDAPVVDGDQITGVTVSIDAAATYDPFDALVDEVVNVTTTDADLAGFLLTESGGTSSVSESGSTDTFTAELTAQPLTNVVLNVASGDIGEATVDVSTLTFTPANWATPQQVTITGVADTPLVDGTQATLITISVDGPLSDDLFDPLGDQTVSVSTTDIDAASYTITEVGGTIVAEDGGGNTDDFTVELDARPLTDVVLIVSSGSPGEATTAPATLTFTTLTWNTAQTVTVTGVDDSPLVDGDQPSSVTVSVDAAASDDAWDGLGSQVVTVTTTDTDLAGFAIIEPGGSTPVTEASGPANTEDFTVVLTAQPVGSVLFDVSSGDTGEATVTPATLLFNNGTWNLPQTVTVTGVDDAVIDGTQNTTVTVAINQSGTTTLFDALASQTLTAATIDDDAAGFTVVETGATTVTEASGTDTYTVVLDAEPASAVVVDVVSANSAEVTALPTSLIFLPAAWNTPQVVTVTGVDDSVDDGDQVTNVTMSIDDVNSDNLFDPVADQTVSVTTVDDDAAGLTVFDGGGVLVAESGSNGSFTVELDTEPISNVVLSVTANDISEATVSPLTLTFTPADWNTPQSVTVTGVDDSLIDGSVGSTVTVSVVAATSDDAYDPVAPATANVTTSDDEIASILIVEQGGSTSVSEAGSTDTYTVVLSAQPASTVVISVSSPDVGEVTAAPTTLTFLSPDWDTPQQVTVTGVDDGVDDGDIVTLVTASVVDASSDDAFDGLSAQVSVTTVDDDLAGITVGAISGTTSEAGVQATFTIVLDSEPTTDVTIAVSSSDPGEGTVAPTSLVFSSANWASPQTVTVTGQDDAVEDGDMAYSIVTAAAVSADPTYNGLPSPDVLVTNLDDDAAGVTVSAVSGATSEAGVQATFTIVLDAEPTADVTIGLTSDDTSEGTVSPGSVTFTNANWSLVRTVTITGIDDDVADGDVGFTIVTAPATSGDPLYDLENTADVAVTNTDDDVVGFSVSAISAATTEAGGQATFTIVLDSEPTGSVTIGLSSDDTGEGTVSPASVVFTTGDWDTPQTVTVTGVDDAIADGDVAYAIVTGAATSTDAGYNGSNPSNVVVTNNDDDTFGITVGPISGPTTESGGEATFTIVLDSEPTGDVTIGLSSDDTTEGTVLPTSVTFTSANWNSSQPVTVTGVDDLAADGSVVYSIVTAPATSTDSNYNILDAADVAVTNTDDETAGITVSPTTGLTTTETGGVALFTIVLDTEPVADVTVGLTSTNTAEGTLSSPSVTFSVADWSSPHVVTVTGVNNDVDDGDVGYTIVTAAATSTDGNYNGINPLDASVTNVDDDTAGITVGAISGPTTEAGGPATFTIVLDSEPTANVSIGLSSDDATEGTVSPSPLLFTSLDWNTPRTVTVTGVDDAVDDGDIGYNVITSAATSGDPDYTGRNALDVSVTNTDDDTAGFTISAMSGPTNEAGNQATFTIVLDSEPTGDVTVGISSSDTSEGTVTPASVMFTAANWNSAQTVTVTGIDDAVDDGDIPYSIVTAAATSTDPDYSVDPPDVAVTNTDDDTSGISVGAISGTTSESGNQATFTIVLDSEPTGDVAIGLSSDDLTEGTVSPSSVTFTNVTWNTAQTVTATGVDDDEDDGDIGYNIVIAAATSTDTNYSGVNAPDVAVTNIDDDDAGFTVTETGGGTSVNESSPGNTDTFDVVLDARPTTPVTLNFSSNDTGEATVIASVMFTPGGWDTPQPVTVTAVDEAIDDGDQNTNIDITVDPGSATEFLPVPAQIVVATTVDDDTAGFTITESGMTSVTEAAGGGNTDSFDVVLTSEPTSNVQFTIVSGDLSEATVTSPLVFTPANWAAPQTVTVTGVDDSFADGDSVSVTTVSVDAGNSDDTYDPLPNQAVNVTTVDDEVAGFTVIELGGNTVTDENGLVQNFTVVLLAQPETDVVFTITEDDLDNSEIVLGSTTLTFTTSDWDTLQNVTVIGLPDGIEDGDTMTTITISVDDAQSPVPFGALLNAIVLATNLDID